MYLTIDYLRGLVDSNMLNEVGELIEESKIYLGGAWPIDNTDDEVERREPPWICTASSSNDLNDGICRQRIM